MLKEISKEDLSRSDVTFYLAYDMKIADSAGMCPLTCNARIALKQLKEKINHRLEMEFRNIKGSLVIGSEVSFMGKAQRGH